MSVACVVDWETRCSALDDARPVRMEFDGRLSVDEQRMVRENVMRSYVLDPAEAD